MALRIIGLTGGIACGKSTVSAYLREQPDVRVIDGDELSHKLTAAGGSALEPIRETFGNSFFLSDGSLNRSRLGEVVFSDFRARASLDALMAPLLEAETNAEIEKARESGALLCFLDYPLLFEKGYDRLCHSVWCVVLPEALQLQRLMERDGLAEAEALSRIRAVLSSGEKAARSQVVIDNSGSVSYTLSLLPSLLEQERQLASAPRRRRSARYETEASSPSPAENGSGIGPAVPRPAFPAETGGVSAVPPPTPQSLIPTAMERPAAAHRKRTARKAAWRLPFWMMVTLIILFSLLLTGITAQSLMCAYLTRQEEKHQQEAQAILNHFPLEYKDLIVRYAGEYNLNPAFVAAIIRYESSFQPRALSNVGARGLMQLMPDTAEWIAHKLKVEGYSFDRMWDPESNIRFGCWYLNFLSALFQGDPVCVACAYHAGQNTVIGWLSDPLISENGTTLSLDRLSDGPTKTYAGRITKAYGIYQVLYFEADPASAEPDAAAFPRPGIGHQRGEQPGHRNPERENPDRSSAPSGGKGYPFPL